MTRGTVKQAAAVAVGCLALSAASAHAQGRAARGNEEVEPFTRSIRLGENGRVSVANLAGDITVRRVSGDELTIEAVKRTRGDRRELEAVVIEVNERAGRVTVATQHPRRDRRTRSNVRVDYTIGVPGSAIVDVQSASGSIRATEIRGRLRAETMSGNVTVVRSPRVELAKSVSGTVDVSDLELAGGLEIGTMSGNVVLKQVKGRTIQVSTITGDVDAADVACEQLEMESLSGDMRFSGRLTGSGRYAFNSHSGDLVLVLEGDTGFELSANSFSGEITSNIPVTLGQKAGATPRRGAERRAVSAVFGDGSALLDVHTFSGDISISRK